MAGIFAVDRPCAVCGHQHTDGDVRRVWPRKTPQGDRDLCDRCEHEHRELQFPRGLLCRKHFDSPREPGGASLADVDVCPDCIAAHKAESDRIQQNDTIDPDQPYGQHIALTCRNHPELRWSTKNIDCIGARSIFFSSMWDWEPGTPLPVECDCPMSDLEVVK